MAVKKRSPDTETKGFKTGKVVTFEDNKKGPYKTGGRVEGAMCELTEAIGRYGVQVTPTAPGGNMGSASNEPLNLDVFGIQTNRRNQMHSGGGACVFTTQFSKSLKHRYKYW